MKKMMISAVWLCAVLFICSCGGDNESSASGDPTDAYYWLAVENFDSTYSITKIEGRDSGTTEWLTLWTTPISSYKAYYARLEEGGTIDIRISYGSSSTQTFSNLSLELGMVVFIDWTATDNDVYTADAGQYADYFKENGMLSVASATRSMGHKMTQMVNDVIQPQKQESDQAE